MIQFYIIDLVPDSVHCKRAKFALSVVGFGREEKLNATADPAPKMVAHFASKNVTLAERAPITVRAFARTYQNYPYCPVIPGIKHCHRV